MNLKVPGLEFSSVKAYQFREKELSAVSQHGHLHASGYITLHNIRHYSVRTSNAWRIVFKNVSNTPVNVMLNFSIHDKYSKRDDFTKVVRNLRPDEPADIDLTLSQKAEKLQLNTIEVYHDEELISRIEVNRFLPRMAWGPKAWLVGLVLAYLCTMMNVDLRPNNNLVNIMLPFFGLTLMGAGLVKRTPVVIVLLFFAALPFSTHSLERIAILAVFAALYLVVVWIRRRSIKDFFMTTATA